MRTNGFALFAGEESRAAAVAAAERVRRHCQEVVTGPVEGGICVAYSLEKGRPPEFPLVHGFSPSAGGEFAYLERQGEGFSGGRDSLGTRGLYADRRWKCIASDHRFFTTRPRLFPPGARIDTAADSVVTSEIASQPSGLTLEEAAATLAELLTDSVRRKVSARKKVAISFSGGLDSSLLALLASRETEVVLCSTYARDSRDEGQTGRAAEALGLRLVDKRVNREDVVKEVRAVELPFQPGPMDLALWTLYSTTARTASEEGAELIMLGQLADELFGGYMKYALTSRRSPVEAELMMRADVVACGCAAFIRDEAACARFSEVRFPYADEEVARFAFGLPLAYKISGGERKVVLRRAAALLGLPESLSAAPKKAAQYSSGIAKLVP